MYYVVFKEDVNGLVTVGNKPTVKIPELKVIKLKTLDEAIEWSAKLNGRILQELDV